MYLRINSDSEKENEKLKGLLIRHNISFDEFTCSTDMFFDEEAPYKLRAYVDIHHPEFTQIEKYDFINKRRDELAYRFSDNDCIIDSEFMEELTEDFIAEETL